MTGLEIFNKIKKEYPKLLDTEIKEAMSFVFDVSFSNPKLFTNEFLVNKKLLKILRELNKGKPIELIIKKAKFLNLELEIKKGVLIPRNETEELTLKFEEYIIENSIKNIADIGTGSGCIAAYLKSKNRGLNVYAVEKESVPFSIAKSNFKRLNLDIKLFKGDCLFPLIKKGVKIDALISNPPYITPKEFVQDSVKKYEPKSALYLTEFSLYENIFLNVEKVINRFPFVMYFEMSPENEELILNLIEIYLKPTFKVSHNFFKDINGYNRFVKISLEKK